MMYRECKACKGECVQTRNDGIKVECPSCNGTGKIDIRKDFYYEVAQPTRIYTGDPPITYYSHTQIAI